MKVYLAGPIHGQTDDECKAWRNDAKRLLEHAGHGVLDPMERDYRGVEDSHVEEIVFSDKRAIDSCDALLVNAARPSWGTAMEVAYGHSKGKVVVLFCCKGQISPWLRFHSTKFFGALNDAVCWLPPVRQETANARD